MDKQVKPDVRPYRELYQVWIDGAKTELKPVIKQFNRWKSHRKLTAWILDMWRLWVDLTEGNSDVLIELFPAFCDRLVTSDGDKLLQAIYDQNAEQIRLLKELKDKGVTIPAPQSLAGLKPLASTFKVAPPMDDEDTIVVNVDKSAGTNATASFLDAAFGFQRPTD